MVTADQRFQASIHAALTGLTTKPAATARAMMHVDIKDVSLVASCRSREESRLVQQLMIACGLTGYHIKQDLRSSVEVIVATSPDAVLFIADKEEAPMKEFFKRIRAPDFRGNRYMPIIVGMWHPSVVQIKQAIEIGANEILSLPANTETMTRAIHRAVFVGRPFIDVPTYFGPCRRRKQMPNYGPKNRRKTQWEYSHISVQQAVAG